MLYIVQHMNTKIWIKHKLTNYIMFIDLFIKNMNIYWSNVLTERFSNPYKNQTKEDKSF